MAKATRGKREGKANVEREQHEPLGAEERERARIAALPAPEVFAPTAPAPAFPPAHIEQLAAPAHTFTSPTAYSVEPKLPVTTYTSFFDLLEATLPNDPFREALSDFIRSPESDRPTALRALWDAGHNYTETETRMRAQIHDLKQQLRQSQRVANEEGDKRFKEGKTLGYKTGIDDGRAQAKDEHDKEFRRKVRAIQREALDESDARYKEGKEKGHTQGYEEGYTKAVEDCKETKQEDCAYENCDGALRERHSWNVAGHTKSGRCPKGRPQYNDASTQANLTLSPPPQHLVPTSTTADPVPPPISKPKLDWADDAASIPIIPIFHVSPSSRARDISVLRSHAAHPFGSLQRRARTFNPRQRTRIPMITRPPPTPVYSTKPTIRPSTLPMEEKKLESRAGWTADPRSLVKLAQVLELLGWSPPR